MSKSSCTDDEFINLFREHGPTKMAKILGTSARGIHIRRRSIEKKKDIQIISPAPSTPHSIYESIYPSRVGAQLINGTILIGSDAHYWPEIITTAHKGFVHLKKELKPDICIMNGDVFDGARASRHPRIGWAKTPTIKEELEAVEDRLHEIVMAHPSSKHFWTIGNHDSRFENVLSNKVPEMEDVDGFTLSGKFPPWEMATSIWVNDDIVIKHRFKGGIHATHNNTMWSGKTIVTGHLHSLKVTPFSDYNGTRFGIDTGTLTVPSKEIEGDPSTAYNEDNPQNHRSGFIVLTIVDGLLLWPEICRVVEEGLIDFRGKLIKV